MKAVNVSHTNRKEYVRMREEREGREGKERGREIVMII